MSGALNMLKGSVSSIVTLLIGLFVFVSIPNQIVVFESEGVGGVTARTVPYIIASLIIFFSLIMIVSDVIRTRNEEAGASENDPQETTSYGRVLLAFAAITLWIVILPYLGFNIATFMLVAAIMTIIGNCQWWQIVLLSLILSVPIKFLLAIVLQVYLPSGSVFG